VTADRILDRDLPPRRVVALRRNLQQWYVHRHRRLPWRAAPRQLADPYHVLVSEAMLQQTQVATVIPYYERFMAALPTLPDLACADPQQVLRLWQGLGYYRRARHLHAAARAVVTDHDGQVPSDPDLLATLPGIGRYTAAAIASIAFGRRAALVDGNVARVLARLLAIPESIDEPTTQRRLWALAQRLVPPRHPGDWNQALMELGAVICTPRQPACGTCPVRRCCAAFARGRQHLLPTRSPRRAPQAVTHHVVAVARSGTYLFEQRPVDGLWADLWQMPTWEQAPDRPDGDDLVRWVAAHTRLKVAAPRPIGTFEHATTHRAVTFRLWRTTALAGRRRTDALWRSLDDLEDLPLARPQQRVTDMLAAARPQRTSTA
jgi:A/G-specific adenine glycosylase